MTSKTQAALATPKSHKFASGTKFTTEASSEVIERKIMIVSMMLPHRVAALLDTGRKHLVIQSASMPMETDIVFRRNVWNRKHTVGLAEMARPVKEFLPEMIAEGCDQSVTVKVPILEWYRIAKLAKMLKITAADYLLGCAGYNAWVEASRAITPSETTAIEGRTPIYFPTDAVKLLEELCEASGFGDVEKYAVEFLSSEIRASLDPTSCGVPEIIAGSYKLRRKDKIAMQAVIDRWNAKKRNSGNFGMLARIGGAS